MNPPRALLCVCVCDPCRGRAGPRNGDDAPSVPVRRPFPSAGLLADSATEAGRRRLRPSRAHCTGGGRDDRQGGSRRAAWAPPSPSAAASGPVTAGRHDRGGPDRGTADDGGQVRLGHSPAVRVVGSPATQKHVVLLHTLRKHVGLLSGKVHAVPTRATAAAAEAAGIIRGTRFHSGDLDGFLN